MAEDREDIGDVEKSCKGLATRGKQNSGEAYISAGLSLEAYSLQLKTI